MKQLVGTKTITTIQAGGLYKERWTCPSVNDPFPASADGYTIFKDSAGAEIVRIDGEFTTPITGGFRHLEFLEQPEVLESVPNGAAFEVIVEDEDGPNYFKYGTVFRRQNFFPHSPAEVNTFEPKRYTDTFQRPPGALGGRWRNLVGRPRIFDNTGDIPNSVGPDYNFFSQYFARYYVPFNGDSVDLSISVIDKGTGTTVVTVCSNSDGSQALYVDFKDDNSVGMGVMHGPDIGNTLFPTGVLEPMVTRATGITIPTTDVRNFKLRFDEATMAFTLYNDDYTETYQSWTDSMDEAPHGKGYRYFGFGGNSGLFDSGVQVAYISAANIV